MLFEFFMNFLNIEKKKLRIFSSIFYVFFAFYAISNIKKKKMVLKNFRGEGKIFLFCDKLFDVMM